MCAERANMQTPGHAGSISAAADHDVATDPRYGHEIIGADDDAARLAERDSHLVSG